MPKTSAGLLPYRISNGRLEVYVVHPGGPFGWRRDKGVWSIAKGELEAGEDPFVTAQREFTEETGYLLGGDDWIELGEVRQANGKRVLAWATEAPDLADGPVQSNLFEMEWPRGSGEVHSYPEVDRALWCGGAEMEEKLVVAQLTLVARLAAHLARLRLL